jgi:hypothetical protein
VENLEKIVVTLWEITARQNDAHALPGPFMDRRIQWALQHQQRGWLVGVMNPRNWINKKNMAFNYISY